MKLFSQQQTLQSLFPQCSWKFCETIDSTNSECLRLWQNDHKPWIVIANQQTAGRGRRGSIWQSEKNRNIYLSCICKNPFPGHIAAVNFHFGIAIYETLRNLYGTFDGALTLKWPNDVYIGKRKIAGILLENVDNSLEHLIIGIGINVYADAEDLPEIATSVKIETKNLGENERFCVLSELLPKILTFDTGSVSDCCEKFWNYSELTRTQQYTYHNTYQGTFHQLHDDGSITILNHENDFVHIR